MTTVRELERDLKTALRRIQLLEAAEGRAYKRIGDLERRVAQLQTRPVFNPANPDPTDPVPAFTPGWPYHPGPSSPSTADPLPPLPTIVCGGVNLRFK